jgi:hypothetical protein
MLPSLPIMAGGAVLCFIALMMLAIIGGHDVRLKMIMIVITPPIFIVGKSIIAVIYVHYWLTEGLKIRLKKLISRPQDWY